MMIRPEDPVKHLYRAKTSWKNASARESPDWPSQNIACLRTSGFRFVFATWIRLQRLLEDQPSALVLIADGHVSHGPGGAALAMKAAAPRWSGTAPARLLRGVGAEVREARRGLRGATVELRACP